MKGSSQSGAEADGWVRLFYSFLSITALHFRVFSKTRGKTTYFKLHGKERSRNKELKSHLLHKRRRTNRQCQDRLKSRIQVHGFHITVKRVSVSNDDSDGKENDNKALGAD